MAASVKARVPPQALEYAEALVEYADGKRPAPPKAPADLRAEELYLALRALGRDPVEVARRARERWESSVELPTWRGVPVRVAAPAGEAEARVALAALAAGADPELKRQIDFKALDPAVKRAYARVGAVRRAVWERALAKVGFKPEVARAYVKAWLKAEDFELPRDDPDAELVSRHYYKLVWRMGGKYVLQEPPWIA
jgi:hypothetical protein